MDENLLSIGEAAKLMDVCENTLRDWDIEGKFKASRTSGGHRRYSLDQIRDHLEENQPKKKSNLIPLKDIPKELADSWEKAGYLSDIESILDKKILAILLENCRLSREVIIDPVFSSNQALWLTKQSWLRSRFKKLVSVQPMLGPACLVYFMEGNCIKSEAVAAKTSKHGFTIFPKADFEKIKDVYADAIAGGIDFAIFDLLHDTHSCSIEDLLDCTLDTDISLKTMFDYLVGPHMFIETLSKRPCTEGVDLFGIDPVIDNKNFMPLAISGRYPEGTLEPPVFCPYIIFQEGPRVLNASTSGVNSAIMRMGWYAHATRIPIDL